MIKLHVVQFAEAKDDVDHKSQEQFRQLEAAGRGQCLVSETKGRSGVDTAENLCFTGSHERGLALTGFLLA